MKKSLRLSAATLAVTLLVAYSALSNTYTVTTTADAGAGSLRQAILDANANAGADDIVFNIPGGAPWSITVSSALPNLTGPTVIDGTTQPGFVSGTQSTYVKVGTAFTGTIFSASGVTGITIKGLDLSYSSPRGGAGIGFTNCFQTFILDNYIRNRRTGIAINGGQDHTVQNNDLLASGENTNEPCVYLANITPGSIPGGIAMSGNKFGGNAIMGFRFDNMNNLVIGDASVSGAHIVIEDNSGFTAMGLAGHYMLWFNNCNNITIDNVDLSWLGGGVSNAHGVIFSNSVTNSTFTVKNCAIRNRYTGIQIVNGKDVTIQNNDLRGSGHENNYAVNLNNITEANVNGGILMSGNLWGRNTGVAESNGGLRLSNTNNLIIGDENTGVNIKIEDNSGFNTIAGNTSERNAMYLENVSNITVDNVDASWSLGSVVNSMGIRVQNTGSNGNITIKNCKAQNRYYGIYCSDGKDYTITGNDLRGSGHENLYALYLLSIAEGMIPGGVSVSGNTWGRNPGVAESNGGLYIADMSNLIIGDATTGVHIKIEDNSGFNTILGTEGSYRGALWLERVSNIMVDNVDASWSLGGISNSFGIFVQNETTVFSGQTTSHRNVTIKDCDFRNRGQGIRIRGGKDYTVTNNDLRGCGEHGFHALQLINIQAGTMVGGILAHTNKFGTGAAAINNGIFIQQMNDLTIGDATTGGNIKIEDNSGLNQIVGNDVNSRGALYLNTVSNVTVNSVDCSYAPGGQAGNSWGIRVVNTASNSNISILNCLAGNRGRGIWVDNGRDYTITGNNMVGSGSGSPAFELSNIIPGSLTGGILASGNTFGTPGFNRGVAISNMRDLLIGDASVSGANIVLEDNSGLNQCVGADYNSQGALSLGSVNNVTVDNVDCSKSTAGASNSYGIVVGNGANNQGVTIKNCKADNRFRGIYCVGGKDYTVQNNTITNSGWDGTACALDFRDITAGTLTGGVLVSGNTFGNVPITANVSRAGVRFDNMRDLYIGDATTGGNVKLEDGNGLTEVGFDLNSLYVVLNLNNISNSTIDNLDLSYSGTNQNGNAIRLSNGASQGTVTIKDCTINKRRLGIYVGGGRDYTLTGNNLTGTGFNSNLGDINNGGPAVWLNGLVKGTLDGGIAMSGNIFGGTNANCALVVQDMRGFTIGDAVSDDIVLEDGTSGLTNVGNNASSAEFVLYLRQIADVTVNSVDLTRSGGSQFGGGIRVENGTGNKTVSLTNNGVGNRRTGIYISGGSDYTVTGNTLTGSGLNETEPALYFNAITAGTLPGGLSVSGNTFGGTNANTAVRFDNLKDIVIGDASVSGRNVTLEDGTSGLTTVGNNANSLESVLYFSNLTNSSINNVDLTRTGGTQFGRGIYVTNGLSSYPFSITNCAVGNRRTGIHISGGRDYTVQNNTLTGSGNNLGEPALYLNALTVNSNLLINGNTFGGANFNTGIRVENTSDLLISDGTVSGTHIGVTTANGLGNATGNALYLVNLNRTKVQNMDLSFTTTTKTGVGIQITTNLGTTSQVEMKSLTVKNRVDGINIASGANHSVKCSDLSDNTDGLEVAGGVTSFVCEQNSFVGNTGFAINSAATITAENNYFGGGAPGGGANGVTGSVDATPFLASPPANCPSTMAAHMELKGNLNLILNGSTTPTTVNYTDLGSVKTSTPITRTFTINNTGGTALNITSISFTGGNAGDFSAGALTPVSPVPAGGSATFTIAFTPGAAGLRSTTLSIVNDDPNNNPFTAALQGTGKNVLVVTKTADTNDGVCDADCSLREAITVANSNADADVIEFNIDGGGAQTITHTTAFPNITQPLTIDGSSQPGFAGTALITVNSNSSLTTFTASNVTGLTIKHLDLSRPIANYDGSGIIVTSCNEVFILNNVIKNRLLGIQSNGGRDHTIQNNDLQQTGADVNNPAIYLIGLTARDVPGGIKMSGNLFGDAASGNRSRFGVRINTMSNLLIGDASVANAHITIEDGSGMASTGTGDNYCLLLNNVSNTTVDNLDLTATTYGYQGWGVVVSNTADYGNVTVKNCKINNRYGGVYCTGGRDYTIQNNDLQKTGNDVNRPSLWFQNITPGTLPTGILASGNLLGDPGSLTRTALRVDGATGLLIGNQTVSGAHITIEDNSGIKASANGDNYAVYLVNVSNTTVDKLDLSSTIGYQGWGLVVQNSASNSNVTIQNCKMNSRYSGIYCIGGKDYTITGNDLRNTGNDNTRAALYLSGIRPGTLPAGVVASGNLFGTGISRTALRVSDMDGLIIGDAGVVGAHIVIEDASGANTMSTDGDNAVIYLSAVSNLTVNDVDISRSASGRSGVGIWVENSGSTVYRNLSILNCKMQQRDMGIYINGGKDVTVTNNDMRYSGFYQERPALYLTNIQSISLPGGVSLSGNKFGGTFNSATSNSGIQFSNMRDLVMADAAAPGVNIVLEDNSGLNDVYGDEVSIRGVMYLNNVRNVQMTSIDLSKMTAGQGTSFALKVNAGVNVSVLNGKGSNRYHGYYFEGGRDITVTGNDLTGSGNVRDYPALRFSNVQPGSINTTNGITASGNLFGGANVRTGLRIDNAKNLLIGDATVGGAHIVIEDNSGLNNITQGDGNSEHPAIFLSTVSDITVDNVDASRPSGQDAGGIWVTNSITNSNITIKNCNFNRHRRAIYCTGGRDYTIQNNTLLNCGSSNDQPAIYLQNIQQGSLTGGILMSGNTFGGTSSFAGIRFENMRDLTIGDAATGGNVKIEDNSGLNNMGGNGNSSGFYVLHLNNVNNATVDNVDVSRPVSATPAQDFTGIRIDNGAAYGPITIKDCNISRHRVGISAQGGKDYTVTGNDLRGCGVSSDEPALWFNGITQQNGTVPMGILANTNTFGTVNSVVSNCALRLDNLCGIRISDGTVANSHIKLESASGIKEVTGTSGNSPAVILMANTSGMAVEKLDLEFTGTQTGTAFRFQNANASQYDFSIKDNILKNRRMGVFIINGADYTITGNNFSMTGAADDEPAIRMEHVAEGTLYGGVSMSGNTFGGTGAAFGLKFVNMSNLKISDGSLSGTNVNLGAPSANGLYNVTTGNVLHLSGICNATVGMLDLSRAGLTRQGVGLRMNNGMGNIIEKVLVGNRDKGIEIAGGSNSQSFTCNTLFDNNFGVDIVLGTLLSTTLTNNIMDCNGTGLRSTSTSTVAASNNYWGTANGSTTSGGSGDSYSGAVTATPFLATAPACAQTPPDLETKGNSLEIVDGDITPSFSDYTQYCAVTGQTQSRTYTLKNTGNGIMNLVGASPVTLSPASGTPFTITTQPADVELLPGETTTFSIQFAPVALGTSNVTLNIASKDCRENPYNFALKGQGCIDIQGTISGTQAICAGLSANLTVNISAGLAPFVVTLSDGSTFTVNNIGDNTVTVNPTATTTYTITMITDANGCCSTNNGSAIVTVNPLPTPTITVTETSGTTNHDGILCQGATAVLDGGVYTAWEWTGGTTAQTLNVTASGTYTVTVTDSNGCENTDTQDVVVNANPTPTITETDNSGTANDNILCAGGSATLDAGAYSTYTWSPSGNTQTISVSAAGTYTVVVTDVNGCTGTDDQAIAVNALPEATLSGSLLVCPGTTSAMINLNITAGVAPFTVVLSDGSSHTVAAAGMSQLTVAVAEPGPLSFSITSITVAGGCAGSASGTATVDFGSAGEIEISGNGTPIADGDNMPDPADHTDFGLLAVGNNFTRTFTITNSHPTLPLNVSGVTITGSTDFTLMTAPASSVAANGGTTTFVVKFAPTVLGLVSATVVVNSSDCDEQPYNFDVQGKGATPASALHFDGTNDYVSIPGTIVDGAQQATFEGWFKIGSNAQYDALFGKNNLYQMRINSPNTSLYFHFTNIFNDYASTPPGSIPLNTYFHLAVVYDGTQPLNTNRVKIYINGVAQTLGFTGSLPTTLPSGSGTPFTLMAENTGGRPIDGSVDELRIWNTARTCDQITQLRNCELTGSESGLVAYYKFNQGFADENNSTVTTLDDATTNNNDGTLSNTFALTGATSNWVTPGGVTTGTSCPAVTVPEINVQGNGNDIVDGSVALSFTNQTDFAYVANGYNIIRTFTIQNTGTSAMNVTGITAVGGDASMFSIGALTPASPVPAGGSATFTVTYTPTGTGLKSTTLHIASDDCDEADYDFLVRGNTGPNIVLDFGGIPNGAIGNYYNGGAGPNYGITFNPGDASGNALANGANPTVNFPTGFTTSFSAYADLCIGFRIRVFDGLDGTGTQLVTANGFPGSVLTVNFCGTAKSVRLERFSCPGTGYDDLTFGPAPVPVPEIDVQGNLTTINDGDNMPSITDHTDFNGTFSRTFTIQNTMGTAALNISGITSSNAKFVISGAPSSVAASGSDTFTVTYNPTDGTAQTATITVNSDDCDEPVYDFAVTATCTPPSFSACPTGPLTANTVTGTCAAPVSYTVTEAGNPAPTVTYAFTGATTGTGNGTGSGSSFNKGNTTVTVTATGTCNTAATCSFTVTVTDIEKPQITCAGPVTINTTSGLCTGTTTLTEPTVTDNCPLVLGNSLHFDGSNDLVNASGLLDAPPTQFTIEFWLNPASRSDYNQEISIGSAGNGAWNGFTFHTTTTGAVYVGTDIGSRMTPSDLPGNTVVLNTWQHFAYVLSGGTGKFYKNGVLLATKANGTPPSFNVLRIASGCCNPVHGALDELRIWNTARTQAQIQDAMKSELSGSESNLVAYYNFNQGVANDNNAGITTLNDLATGIGGANNGTLTGFGLNGAASNWVEGVSLNNLTNNAPTTYPKGNTTVTWTATDASGNTQTCQQIVTVTDNELPVLTVPAANIPLNVIATTCAANYTIADPVSDNCTGATWTYTLSGATIFGPSAAIADGTGSGVLSFNAGVTTVLLSATDGTNNATTVTFTVTVVDNTAPSITCPSAQTLVLGASCTATLPNYTSLAATGDNCGVQGVTQSPAAGTVVSTAGDMTVTLTVTDVSGLTNTCTFTVTKVDNTPPSISCPATQTLVLGANCTAALPDYTSFATTGDNCGVQGVTQSPAAGTVVSTAGDMTVTLTVTDVNGLTNSCTFTVTKVDNTPPSITCPATQTLALGANCTATLPNYTSLATTGDYCGVQNVTQSPIAGTVVSSAGNMTVTLTVTDVNGLTNTCTFTVTKVDNTPPSITCPATQTLALGANCTATLPNYTSLATTGDNCGVQSVTQSSAAGTTVSGAGNMTVTLTVTDVNGLTNSCTFTVSKVDNTPPTITCPATQTLVLGANCTASLPDYTGLATTGDNCGVQSVTQSPAAGTTVSGAGNMTVTLTVTDVNGLTSFCTFTVTKVDNTAPSITCPATQTLALGANCSATLPDYTNLATTGDGCGVQSVTQSPAAGTTVSGAGNMTVTLTVTDINGLTNTCTFTVSKVDNTPPSITCPNTQTLVLGANCSASLPDYTSLAATGDNCGVQGVTQSPAAGTVVSSAGNMTVTLTVTDINGLTNTCTFTVTKVDNTPPSITCPATQTLVLGSSCTATLPNYTSLAATGDNCGVQGVTQSPAAGTTVSGAGNMTVTLTVTDINGLTNTCTFTVTKVDNTPPTVQCFNQTLYFNGEESIALDANDLANASDNCGVQGISLSPNTISATQVGQTVPVTVTATDINGNTATCTAPITVSGFPAGWSQQPGGAGCAGNNNTYNTGTGVWTATSTNCFYGPPYTSDATSFVQRTLCGNGSITAQVTSINGSALGWAGIVMRESNAPGAKKAQLMTNLSNLSRREFRTATNAAAQPQQFPSQNRYWLRITRAGNQFTMSVSANGTSWFLIGAQNIAMNNCIQMGLVATNYTANSTVTATFSNVSFTGINGTLALPGGGVTELAAHSSQLEADFNVYPNPTGGELNVDLTQYVGRSVRLEVYSLEGKLLQFTELDEVQTTLERLDLKGFQSGMYLVKVKSDGLPDATKRVVLQRG